MKESGKKEKFIVGGLMKVMLPQQRRKLYGLALFGILRSAVDTASTGAVLPYMYVLLDSEKAKSFPILRSISALAGENQMKFAVLATALFLFLYIIRCAVLVLYDYVDAKLIRSISSDFSVKLFTYYMSRPYEFFFSKNASLMQRNVTTVISELMKGVVSDSLYLVSYILTTVLLLGIILFSGIPGIIGVALALTALYLILSRYVKKESQIIAAEANAHSKILHRTIMECFRGIKDLKLSTEEENITRLIAGEYDAKNALRIRRSLVNSIPRQILEFGTVGILSLILLVGCRKLGIQDSLALLSLCGAAALRIRSSLSSVLNKITVIKDKSAYYDEIIDDIRASRKMGETDLDECPLPFNDRIEVKNIRYRYPNTDRDIFSNFSFTVLRGESIGIVGHSGKGKSTLADLIAGLIAPNEGEILIDGKTLKGNESSWRKQIGYVPQEVFLIDGTILENIAFFAPAEKIDLCRAQKAMETAQILSFVESLPQKENTPVGDAGILLSGGQRQRIGIARALYRNPEILIFDEATNSLDKQTEQALLDTIASLGGEYTMFVIAHNSSALRNCDRIIDLSENSEFIWPDEKGRE